MPPTIRSVTSRLAHACRAVTRLADARPDAPSDAVRPILAPFSTVHAVHAVRFARADRLTAGAAGGSVGSRPAGQPACRPAHPLAGPAAGSFAGSPPGTIALLAAALLVLPLAGNAATWTEAPFETLGDGHRVREGHTADPADIAADAERAAAGVVIGRTAAHDALLRTRPSPDTSRPDDRRAGESRTADPYFATRLDDDTWIADVGVALYRDTDGDGFYGAVDLSIDVDTSGAERAVYAIIELMEPDGTLTLSHVTRTFTIRGNATSDEYRIEIELLENHPAAYRDVRIDVRDAWSDVRLDGISAFDFASLRSLPLESERAFGPVDDGVRHPPGRSDHALGVLLTGSSSGRHDGYGNGYVAGYAGAGGPLGVLALLVVAIGRRLVRGRKASPA